MGCGTIAYSPLLALFEASTKNNLNYGDTYAK
jgi:hypothetical protein